MLLPFPAPGKSRERHSESLGMAGRGEKACWGVGRLVSGGLHFAHLDPSHLNCCSF